MKIRALWEIKEKKSLDRNNGKMKWNKVARKEENRKKKKHQALVFFISLLHLVYNKENKY